MIHPNLRENFIKWIKDNIYVLPDHDLETIADRIEEILNYDDYKDCVDEENRNKWKETIDKQKLAIK